MPPISMLALMRSPMMMPDPMFSSDTPKPRPSARREGVDRDGNRVGDPLQLRRRGTAVPTTTQRADHRERRLARLRAVRVEHDERFARRDAVGEGQILVFDEMLAQRHGEEHAEQARRRQPHQRLHARQVHVEAAAGLGGEHVEGGEQPAEKRDLSRRRCRRSARRCSPSGCSSSKRGRAPESRRTPRRRRCSGRSRTSVRRRDRTRR